MGLELSLIFGLGERRSEKVKPHDVYTYCALLQSFQQLFLNGVIQTGGHKCLFLSKKFTININCITIFTYIRTQPDLSATYVQCNSKLTTTSYPLCTNHDKQHFKFNTSCSLFTTHLQMWRYT